MVRGTVFIGALAVLISACGGSEDGGSDDAGADETSSESGASDDEDTTGEGGDTGDESDATDGGDTGADLPLPLPPEYVPQEGEFMVVFLPDTQIYAQSYPETFTSQTRWIAEHAEAYNIVFVSHVGDVVQHANRPDEWVHARAAYEWLEDYAIPHGLANGGHDVSADGSGYPDARDNSCSVFSNTDCDAVEFVENFGPQRFEGESWYLGASPSGRSSAQLVDAGAFPLLFVHMPQDTPAAEVEWAAEQLDAHPEALAHITTHRYLYDYRLTDELPFPLTLLKAQRFNTLTYTLGGQSQMYNSALTADELFEQLVSSHPNVWSVTCGHVDAEFKQASDNSAGLQVHEFLVDFQDMDDGGGGWLRMLRYRPANNEVQGITFSTLTGEVRENGAGFEHSIGILEKYSEAYADDLSSFGLDPADVEALLMGVQMEGPERDEYYESLYGQGKRDSVFTLSVDFQAYIDAAQ